MMLLRDNLLQTFDFRASEVLLRPEEVSWRIDVEAVRVRRSRFDTSLECVDDEAAALDATAAAMSEGVDLSFRGRLELFLKKFVDKVVSSSLSGGVRDRFGAILAGRMRR